MPDFDPRSMSPRSGEGERNEGFSPLVGVYRMQIDPSQVLELREDGTACMAGDQVPWTAENGILQLGPERVAYRLVDQALVFNLGGVMMAWQRISGPPAGQGAAPLPRADAGGAQASYVTPDVAGFPAAYGSPIHASGPDPMAPSRSPATPVGPAPNAPAGSQAPAPNLGGDPTGAWDTPQGMVLLRPNGTGRFNGQEVRWGITGTLIAITQGNQQIGVPFTATGDTLVLGTGPVVTCHRAGVAGVWVGTESSLDPQCYMSFSQIITLLPDGNVSYSKAESGATRTQVTEHLERFRYFANQGRTAQSMGRWQSDGNRVMIAFAFRADAVEGWIDPANMTLQLSGMGKLPGNEGGPVVFSKQ